MFSVLGTNYGGDGRTTFGLPDLRSRVPVHAGNMPGNVYPMNLGDKSGTQTNTITVNQMPNHTHTASVTGITAAFSNGAASIPVNTEEGNADGKDPSAGILAHVENDIYTSEDADAVYGGAVPVTGDVTITGGNITVDPTGGQQAIGNMQPYQTVNFIIALQGDYPSRS